MPIELFSSTLAWHKPYCRAILYTVYTMIINTAFLVLNVSLSIRQIFGYYEKSHIVDAGDRYANLFRHAKDVKVRAIHEI